ncbi:YqaJ viral recombinase family nuclease [Actinomadura kijaniata]|uniref:YqaJ viral recombinase family nuclease n=1 Tax=Actinomadura kijaniata TaxID=46161 RepID=UPI0008325B12|nr:YqaJ viral recombinase family protein [Actinomadura kijaniata]
MPTTGDLVPGLPDARLIAPADLADKDRPLWLQLRRQGLGGSDIAAICGLNPYTSALAVYHDKRGELPYEGESQAARWGRRLEEVIAQGWSEETGIPVHHSPGMLAHLDLPWMLANPDRTFGEGRLKILEIKNRSAWQDADWQHGVPDGPALQLQWYLAVTGAEFGAVAALVGGNRLRYHYLDRDQALIDDLIKIAERFWADVQAGRPPATC